MSTTHNETYSCSNCGTDLHVPLSSTATDLSEAQARIRDLEAQVKLLNSKAAAAVDKLADYEDEIRFLREQNQRLSQQQHTNGNYGFASPPPEADQQRPATAHGTGQSRIASLSSLWAGRKASPSLTRNGIANGEQVPPVPGTPMGWGFAGNGQVQGSIMPPPSPGFFSPGNGMGNTSTLNLSYTTSSQVQQQPDPILTAALEAERRARQRAESTLSQTQNELEDLTAKLFGEANEMVAAERRARAKLEERVRVLEGRDGEKRRRLERLEGAVKRIERVRDLVG